MSAKKTHATYDSCVEKKRLLSLQTNCSRASLGCHRKVPGEGRSKSSHGQEDDGSRTDKTVLKGAGERSIRAYQAR